MHNELVSQRIVSTHDVDSPSLEPAIWRVLDAGERCNSIDVAVQEAKDEGQSSVFPRVPTGDAERTLMVEFDGIASELEALERRATTLASEVLHHSRAALDYCAHYACWSDSGRRHSRSQFPLAGTHGDWLNNRRKGWTRGMSELHLEWVRQVQPCEGVEWSKNLNVWSNSDKHRVAVELVPAYELSFERTSTTADPLGHPGHVGFEVVARRFDLLMRSADADPELNDAVPALPMLWDIVKGTASVVNKFLDEADMGLIEIEPIVSETIRFPAE